MTSKELSIDRVYNTYLNWFTPLQAFGQGLSCVVIGGNPGNADMSFQKPESPVVALLAKYPKREQKRQFQDRFQSYLEQRNTAKIQWRQDYERNKSRVQYFMKVDHLELLEVSKETRGYQQLYDFLFANTVYSERNLEEYFRDTTRKIHIFVGRVYALDEPIVIDWNLHVQSYSNPLVQPADFDGIDLQGHTPKLVPLVGGDQDYQAIIDDIVRIGERIRKGITVPKPKTAKTVPSEPESLNPNVLAEDTFDLLVEQNLFFPLEKLQHIAFFLAQGDQIILTGRPGTGKSSIAEAFAKVAQQLSYITSYDVCTATANWTAYETVGGYMLGKDQGLEYNEGVVTRALQNKSWIIIDEINRADIDKAFGSFFSVLAGQDVTLSEIDDEGNPYSIPGYRRGLDRFRLIGTMNTSDKASLFQLSYALKRRFIMIDVDHNNEVIRRIMDKYLPNELPDEVKETLKSIVVLWDVDEFPQLPLGPALLVDLLRASKMVVEGNPSSVNSSVEELLKVFILNHLDYISEEVGLTVQEVFNNLPLWSQFSKKLHREVAELAIPLVEPDNFLGE